MIKIHQTALVAPDARLGAGCEIGPWAIVSPGAVLGENCVVAPRAVVGSGARVGNGVKIGVGALVAVEPQDLKYDGSPTLLEVGDGCTIREYATLSASTDPERPTRIGPRCLVMAYGHVGHDCEIGANCVLSNGVQLAGFVALGDGCNLGGLSAVAQNCTLGAGVFVGGLSKVDRDVPPYSKALGNPARWGGFNRIAAERMGLPPERAARLERALRELYRSGRPAAEVLAELASDPGLGEYADFVMRRRMGLIQVPRGNR